MNLSFFVSFVLFVVKMLRRVMRERLSGGCSDISRLEQICRATRTRSR
jgi:hypothetical protein